MYLSLVISSTDSFLYPVHPLYYCTLQADWPVSTAPREVRIKSSQAKGTESTFFHAYDSRRWIRDYTCLLRYKQLSGSEIHHNFEILTSDPLIYII